MSFVQYENNVKVAILGSSVGITTTGFANVTGLSLPMMASSVYEFEFEIIYQSSATTRGPGFGVNGPASPSFVLVHTEIPTSLTAVTQGMQRAYDTGTGVTAIDTANANCYARCYGYVSNGTTAGDLILRCKINNTGTITIQPGSVMKMWRVNPSDA